MFILALGSIYHINITSLPSVNSRQLLWNRVSLGDGGSSAAGGGGGGGVGGYQVARVSVQKSNPFKG